MTGIQSRARKQADSGLVIGLHGLLLTVAALLVQSRMGILMCQ